jgi:hypothetical protein
MAWKLTWEELKSHVDRERAFLDWVEENYQLATKAPDLEVPQSDLDAIKQVYRSTGPENPEAEVAGTHRARWNCD